MGDEHRFEPCPMCGRPLQQTQTDCTDCGESQREDVQEHDDPPWVGRSVGQIHSGVMCAVLGMLLGVFVAVLGSGFAQFVAGTFGAVGLCLCFFGTRHAAFRADHPLVNFYAGTALLGALLSIIWLLVLGARPVGLKSASITMCAIGTFGASGAMQTLLLDQLARLSSSAATKSKARWCCVLVALAVVSISAALWLLLL